MEGEKAAQDCVVVEWSIENFTCWNNEVHGDCILQEDIELLDDDYFHLELYPNGNAALDDYLVVRVYDQSCANNGELCIIDSKGSLLWKKPICNQTWRDNFMEIPTNLIFKDVVKNIVQDPVFKDVITLRYTKKCLLNIVCIDHSKVDAFDIFVGIPFEILRDLPLIKKYFTSFYCRFDGRFRGYDFNLSSVESMVDGIECSFELEGKYLHVSNVVHCYLYVLNSDNSSIMFKEIECTAEGKSWKFKHTLPNDIIEELFSFLIRFKILYGKEYINYTYSSQDRQMFGISSILHSSAENYSKSIIAQPENAVSLLFGLYQDNHFSDFQLRCESVTFPVHKIILSARSPVFKCMLTSDMKEAASGCLDIEDLDPHTLGRFLAFLYGGGATGEAQLQWEGALKLYYAADKYQVPSLKAECAAVLMDQVSVSNVCDILSLADKHQDDILKSAATDFILINYEDVLESKEWESFMLKDSLLLCKTLTFLGRKSNRKKRWVGGPEM